MRTFRAILICLATLVMLVMLLAASPMMFHENVRYTRAFAGYATGPSVATSRELAEATQEDRRALIRKELVLAAPLVLLLGRVALTSSVLRCQPSNQAMQRTAPRSDA